MPIPTSEEPPKLRSQEELLWWADRVADFLLRNMRSLVLPSTLQQLSNGATHNLDVGNAIIVRVTGPTGVFNITGVAGGVDGRVLVIYNSTVQNMTINHENAGSSVVNRFRHTNGADVVTTGEGLAGYVYNNSRWIGIFNQT